MKTDFKTRKAQTYWTNETFAVNKLQMNIRSHRFPENADGQWH